jgi:hypothetical protein
MDRDATSTAWSTVMPKDYGTGLGARTPYFRGSNANQESPGWANLDIANLDQQVGWSNGTNSNLWKQFWH